jgi:hypothetical protein
LIDDAKSQKGLKIVAYHEVGHAVVARLLGRPLWYIQMIYSEQARKWEGRSFRDDLPKPNVIWTDFNLDVYIPYADLQFQYPNYPEPYEEYNIVRELCVVAYAGIIAEELFYKQYGIDENPEQLGENALDINEATDRIKQKFSPQEWEEELCYAKTHVRSILSNPVSWRLVENIVEDLTNHISQSTEPDEQLAFHSRWYFPVLKIYSSFRRTLIGE